MRATLPAKLLVITSKVSFTISSGGEEIKIKGAPFVFIGIHSTSGG